MLVVPLIVIDNRNTWNSDPVLIQRILIGFEALLESNYLRIIFQGWLSSVWTGYSICYVTQVKMFIVAKLLYKKSCVCGSKWLLEPVSLKLVVFKKVLQRGVNNPLKHEINVNSLPLFLIHPLFLAHTLQISGT